MGLADEFSSCVTVWETDDFRNLDDRRKGGKFKAANLARDLLPSTLPTACVRRCHC